MIDFIARYYGLNREQATTKRREILRKYRTSYTLIAMRNEGVDEDEFIRATYLKVNPSDYGISDSPDLRNILLSCKGERIVLTNNVSEFANAILCSLGIRDLFSSIVGMRERNFAQKPDTSAFGFVQSALRVGRSVAFLDDGIENIKTTKQLGCVTILVKNRELTEYADFRVQLS
jgi:FMN phosphatase YigB (HAD superfamily)